MTDQRPPKRRLINELKEAEAERDALRVEVAQLRAVLEEDHLVFLASYLKGKVTSFELFRQLVGVEAVVGDDFRLDYGRVDEQLRVLVARFPELGVPPPNVGGCSVK